MGEGMHGGETAIAHLGLKAAENWIVGRGKCSVTLYTDIIGAFASMWRQVILPCVDGDEQILHSLSAVGVESNKVEELYRELIDLSFWIKGGASTHALAVTAELHNMTWSAVDGAQGIMRTYRGASAGTTLAGAFFSVAISRPIMAYRKAMATIGLLSSFDSLDVSPIFGAAAPTSPRSCHGSR